MNRNAKWYAWIRKVSIVTLICTTLDRCGHMSFVWYHARFWRTEWCDCEDDEQMMNCCYLQDLWSHVMFGYVWLCSVVFSLFSRCFLVVFSLFSRCFLSSSRDVCARGQSLSRSPGDRGVTLEAGCHIEYTFFIVFWWSEYCDILRYKMQLTNSPLQRLQFIVAEESAHTWCKSDESWWYLCIESFSLAAKPMLCFFLARSDLVLVSDEFKCTLYTGLLGDPLETLSGSDRHATLLDFWLHNQKCYKNLQAARSVEGEICVSRRGLQGCQAECDGTQLQTWRSDMIRSGQMRGDFDQIHDSTWPFEPNYCQIYSEFRVIFVNFCQNFTDLLTNGNAATNDNEDSQLTQLLSAGNTRPMETCSRHRSWPRT